jgi:hypothetical protein
LPRFLDDFAWVVLLAKNRPEVFVGKRKRPIRFRRRDDAHSVWRPCDHGRGASDGEWILLNIALAVLRMVVRGVGPHQLAEFLQAGEPRFIVRRVFRVFREIFLAVLILARRFPLDGLEKVVAHGRKLKSVVGVIRRDTTGTIRRVVKVIAPMELVGVAGEDGKKLRRVEVIAPVQERAKARRTTVEAAGQYLKGTDQRYTQSLGECRQRFERSEAVDEFPETEKVVGKIEAV